MVTIIAKFQGKPHEIFELCFSSSIQYIYCKPLIYTLKYFCFIQWCLHTADSSLQEQSNQSPAKMSDTIQGLSVKSGKNEDYQSKFFGRIVVLDTTESNFGSVPNNPLSRRIRR